MNEFIEKLIGMLEELYARNDKTKKMAYEEQDWEKFDIFTHRCEGIYSAISIVNQLAEEYNNGWIPCSERLPKITEEVLVTQFFEDSGHHNVTNASLIPMLDGSGRVRWCCYDHFITHVIAWQPLPQPYQPKGE